MAFLPTSLQQLAPVIVNFVLVLAVDLEGDGFGEFEVEARAGVWVGTTAVQGEEGGPREGEVDSQDFAGGLMVVVFSGLYVRGYYY